MPRTRWLRYFKVNIYNLYKELKFQSSKVSRIMIKSFKSVLSKAAAFQPASGLLATPSLAQFHNSNAYSKKLSIGEASVVLEEKISKITQLVSQLQPTLIHSYFARTTSRNSVLSFQLVTVLPESSVSPRSKQEKWWNSPVELEVWRLTWKPTMSVLSSWVMIGKQIPFLLFPLIIYEIIKEKSKKVML